MYSSGNRKLDQYLFFFLVLVFYLSLKSLIFISSNEKLSETSSIYLQLTLTDSDSRDSINISSQHLWNLTFDKNFNKKVFNQSCVHLLGLPHWLQNQCSDNTSNFCQQRTCLDLLLGSNKEVYKTARRFKKQYNTTFTSELVMKLTTDCSTFRQKMDYNDKQAKAPTEQFPIAFSLIVHEDALQVERLLRSIYRPHNVYCIHVDSAATPQFRQAMRSLSDCFENVRLSSRSEIVSWGGYSRLQADINCMSDHMASKVQWKYLINTAGQAFPLKTVEEMVRVLKIYNGANDIEGIYGARVVKDRFEDEWKEDSGEKSVVKTGRRNPSPPHSLDIVRGSAYGIFSRDFVKFILEDQKAIDLRNWSRSTWSPDELYWSTLHHTYSNPHLHTPGSFSGKPDSKPWLAVFANWDPNACHGKSVRSVCVFGVEDLPDLLTRREFFANKFYSDFQPLALDCLESWVKHKELCPVEFDESFYRSLPFIYRDGGSA